MNPVDLNYFSRRAEQELDRAKDATCVEAGHVHAEMAEHYLARLAEADALPRPVADRPSLSLAEEQALQQAGRGKLGAHPLRSDPVPLLRN